MSVAKINDDFLVLSRDGTEIAIDRKALKECQCPAGFAASSSIPYVFILGAYEVNSITYIAFATRIETVCPLWDINKVAEYRVIQLSKGATDAAAEELVKQGLGLSTMYYSASHNLANNALGQAEKREARHHFVWNWEPLERLFGISGSCRSFGQHVVAGFVGYFKRDAFEFLLVSRRSAIRAGTRLWMRGADEDGRVANFVETEQVVVAAGSVFSFVQIRGSVPMEWSQCPDLSRLPRIALGPAEACEKRLNAHFATVTGEYGPVIAVSLTDHKGREKEITERYNDLGAKAKDVRFQYFDFHTECRKMHYENIDKLIAMINDGIEKYGYTKIVGGNVEKKQEGVVRTNCIDCLDRTNVVQSVVAKLILKKQLGEAGIEDNWDADFRNQWTDNADAISCQYAGTPALKTDYTRTGKRTFQGMIDDGKNAVVRYYVNTCTDGTRQDAYDAVTQTVPCNGYKPGNNLFMVLLLALYTLVMFLVLSLTQGKKVAKEKCAKLKSAAVNRPHFRKTPDLE